MNPAERLARIRVCYLHGRPAPHTLHGRFAESVGGEFRFVDAHMPWQDRRRSVPFRAVSTLVNAILFPGRKKCDVFLVDNLHFAPVVMKLLFPRRSRGKIIAHLGSHTLYFLHAHRFQPWVERLHRWALRRYDALLCEGRMAEDLVRRILPEGHPPTYVTFLGPPRERAAKLASTKPALESKKILVIATGPAGFRAHYKGLDLMLDAFERAAEVDPALELDVLGDWGESTQAACLEGRSGAVRDRVHFRGRVDDIERWLSQAGLVLHCSRGDAFPTATIEAMAAGLVPLVSEWTGTREIVERVDERLVAPLDAQTIADRIGWYFALDHATRADLSARCRSAAARYTEEAATRHYQETFLRACEDLGVGP